MLSSLIEIRKKEMIYLEASSKKHLATSEEKNPIRKFVNNAVLQLLEDSNSLSIALEKRKITNWAMNDDYILILLNEIKQSSLYAEYMKNKKSSFEEDKDFVIDMFSELIAPNEKLYEYLEDNKLTWIDDIPLVNTQILKAVN
jgi:N utilization substance protein B